MKWDKFGLAAVTGLMMLSGCSATTVMQAEGTSRSVRENAATLYDASKIPMAAENTDVIRVSEDVWLGANAVKRKSGERLPRSVQKNEFRLLSSSPLNIIQATDLIYEATGIPVQISDDVREYIELEDTFDVDHTGSLSKFLDRVTRRAGVKWRYDGSEIEVFRFSTHLYTVGVLPGTKSGSMDIEGANLTSSYQYNVNLWDDLLEGLQSILDAGVDGSMSGSESTGSITVTASDTTLRKIERYMKDQNEKLSKQVAINVQVYNVSQSDTSEIGSDLAVRLAKSAVANATFTLSGAQAASSSALTNIGWTVLEPKSGVSDIEGVINLLNSQGDVSIVTSTSQTTMNNIPTPVQVGNNKGYVETITEGVDENGATTYTAQTSEISSGFVMQLVPRILNQKISLTYNVSSTELVGANDGFNQRNVGGEQIQLLDVNNRTFSNQVSVPNGATLVLSGFEQATARSEKSGLGSPDNWLFGGSKVGSMKKESMVVLITPTILDTSDVIKREEW